MLLVADSIVIPPVSMYCILTRCSARITCRLDWSVKNMATTDVVGLCITVGISALFTTIGLGLAIFFGLRSFTGGIGKKVSEVKKEVIAELGDIKRTVMKLDVLADKAWVLVESRLIQASGTVDLALKNFGKTEVEARPSEDDTSYIIRVEKHEALDLALIGKLSKSTNFEEIEREMLGGEAPSLARVGSSAFRYTIPSTDAQVCTRLVSLFLKWMDTEYIEARNNEIALFEANITV